MPSCRCQWETKQMEWSIVRSSVRELHHWPPSLSLTVYKSSHNKTPGCPRWTLNDTVSPFCVRNPHPTFVWMATSILHGLLPCQEMCHQPVTHFQPRLPKRHSPAVMLLPQSSPCLALKMPSFAQSMVCQEDFLLTFTSPIQMLSSAACLTCPLSPIPKPSPPQQNLVVSTCAPSRSL